MIAIADADSNSKRRNETLSLKKRLPFQVQALGYKIKFFP
jgi:hypothetical protein